MTGQLDLEGIGSSYGSEPLPLVNALREDLKKWRKSNYEGATQTTRKLLQHWQGKDRKRRIFFCQIEAAETIIYLNEILAAGRARRGTAAVSPEDYATMIAGQKPGLASDMGDEFFPRLCDQPWDAASKPLIRYGTKMATGSGKTVVMGMLIAWTFCNRGVVPGDTRFPQAILIACPNLTVRERLQVLRPDNPVGNYFDQFDLIPSQLRPLLNQGRVLVTNWHAFAPESPHAEAGATFAVVNKGSEGPDAFARRILRDLYGRGELLVLNDEAHHAYRPAPPEKAVKVKRKKGDVGLTDEESNDDRAEATVWVEGLDKINAAVGIRCCVDLSATPFYLMGSGYIPGSPFPWLVSDFGLVDAIESGITKIPRIPVSDQTGRPDPQFFRLWEEIKRRLDPAEIVRGKPKPESVWREAQGAWTVLAGQWQQRFDSLKEAKRDQSFVPPVIIVVSDNVEIAQVCFEKISGETTEDIVSANGADEDEGEVKGRTKQQRVFNPSSVDFPALANAPNKRVSERIDSKLLAEAEAGESGSKVKEGERLRQVIATVGQKGRPGENLRCVVSVQMLTEGWDASNVTQILGLRAFGSQLLCEQVVGRGLRRISYDVDPQTEMLRPEYVDVYGIPFSVIPFRGRKGTDPEPDDKPITHVRALPSRVAMEIKFPNVEGYVLELKKNIVRCDMAKVEPLSIQVMRNPNQVFVQPKVGIHEGAPGTLGFELIQHDRDEYYAQTHEQTVLFEIARQIVHRLTTSQHGVSAKFTQQARHQLFPQVLNIVQQFADSKVRWNGVDRRELGLQVYAEQAVERLSNAIEADASSGEPPLLPVINRFRPHGSTADVAFNTTRPCHPTSKSHVDHVVLDTDTWERSVAFSLEAADEVRFYARNDHLDFAIPYEFYGVSHLFIPDFLVRLQSEVTLVLEVKGFVSEQDEAKFQAAKRWVSAVNNWGRMGKWAFHAAKDPNTVAKEIAYLASNADENIDRS
jgi:type III restriction enzyme